MNTPVGDLASPRFGDGTRKRNTPARRIETLVDVFDIPADQVALTRHAAMCRSLDNAYYGFPLKALDWLHLDEVRQWILQKLNRQ